MKTQLSKTDIVRIVKNIDQRAKKLDDDTIDYLIDRGFAKASSLANIFSSEDVVDLSQYYSANTDVAYQIDKKVTALYKMVLDTGTTTYSSRERKINTNFIDIELDNRESDIVWFKFKAAPPQTADLTLKYFYTPDSSFTNIFIAPDAESLLIECLNAEFMLWLHDYDRFSMHNQQAMVLSGDISMREPIDFFDEDDDRVFNMFAET